MLIVFDHPDSLDKLLSEQNQELKERKLLVFHFVGNELTESNYPGQVNLASFNKLNSQEKPSWYLIGLDGGVKRRGQEMPALKEIFGTIDSMPMRQSELRRKGNSFE